MKISLIKNSLLQRFTTAVNKRLVSDAEMQRTIHLIETEIKETDNKRVG